MIHHPRLRNSGNRNVYVVFMFHLILISCRFLHVYSIFSFDDFGCFYFSEEWITKKKVELTTKKQIETRVKRQVVLEDGKVVEDSGPIVTTNTTEDTEKQEHEQTEVSNFILAFATTIIDKVLKFL